MLTLRTSQDYDIPSPTVPNGTPSMESNAQLQELFSKPEYSDLTIKLSDGQEFRIHKLIVCARNE
jgi:hypothetical protein